MSSEKIFDSLPCFEIFSSLRYDPGLPGAVAENPESYPEPLESPYYLLTYHRDRLTDAARHFQWDITPSNWPRWFYGDTESLQKFLDPKIPEKNKPWRIRIAVDRNGNPSCQVVATAPIDTSNLLIPSLRVIADAPVWRVYVDTEKISPSGFTTHKTSARDDYTAARLRVGINSPAETAEVLMVNQKGEVMEGSITTPYFRRRSHAAKDQSGLDPSWITPPLSSGGNSGTTRRYAVDQGFCIEQILHKDELVNGEECWLSNGVRGFFRGIVVLSH